MGSAVKSCVCLSQINLLFLKKSALCGFLLDDVGLRKKQARSADAFIALSLRREKSRG